jgi:hypothetical protein
MRKADGGFSARLWIAVIQDEETSMKEGAGLTPCPLTNAAGRPLPTAGLITLRSR